jgi:chitinase
MWTMIERNARILSAARDIALILAFIPIATAGCSPPADNGPPGAGQDAGADAAAAVDLATDIDGGVGADLSMQVDMSMPAPNATSVVAYLPNYSGSYADWAGRINFAKMTHLNLAFATATGSNDWNMGASDQEVKAIVDAAHAAGVKVLASLGGGGGDQSVIARYRDAANIDDLVNKLDKFVARLNLDGVDVDIEDPNNLGANYSMFVGKTVAKLRPKGKLVTAAVAQYLQGSMSDQTLHQFDFLNIMIYTTYEDSVNQLKYYSETKAVPKKLLMLGAAFFGTDSNYQEYAYRDILNADPNAWMKDQAQVNGRTVRYTGVASMKKLAEYSKGFGGIMFWELSEDVTGDHSLYKAIQDTI